MKLRILGDTLRMRLAQGEVAQLRDAGQVDQTIHFGAGDEQAIRYEVRSEPDIETMSATLEGLSIVVRIPRAVVVNWADGTEVSLRHTQPREDGELAILVEKDFQCLVPRDGEQDGDGFPHPEADSGATC